MKSKEKKKIYIYILCFSIKSISRKRNSSCSSKCLVCQLPGRGNLPLASCWFRRCLARFHVTCAQMAGIMIGIDVYPHFFYIACDKHPADYHNVSIKCL